MLVVGTVFSVFVSIGWFFDSGAVWRSSSLFVADASVFGVFKGFSPVSYTYSWSEVFLAVPYKVTSISKCSDPHWAGVY